MTPSINVLLIDDHTILRQGLRQLLETSEGICISGEAEDGEDGIVKALSLKPDVILMDINLPKVNGYEASRAILTAWPKAKIIVLTNQDNITVLKKFLDLGVGGFFLKDVQIDTLVDAIQRVFAGETRIISEELAEKMKTSKTTVSKEEIYFALTDREKEVLQALSKGHTNQQLAELLMVSPKTVHNHLYNIYSKIGVKTRTEAVVWALDSGFSQK